MDTFDPDAYLAAKNTAAPTAAPTQVPVDQTQLQQFNPDAYLNQKQNEQYNQKQATSGGTGQQLLGGLEGVMRGRTFGASDLEETALGKLLPDSLSSNFSPEAIKARQEANPITSFVGNLIGGAPAAAGLGALGATGLAGEAAIGGAFGAGNAVSDYALGDPDTNAQKVLADVGMGAALGLGTGLGFKAIGSIFQSAKTLPALMRSIKADPEALAASASATPGITDVPTPSGGKKATTYEQLRQQINDAKKYSPTNVELPAKPDAMAAAQNLENKMQIPISDYDMNSLNSDDERADYKATLQLPGEEGQQMRDAVTLRKKDLTSILDTAIKNISPEYEATPNAMIGGERVADAASDTIQANRDALGPAFEQIKSTPIGTIDHVPGVLEALSDPSVSPRGNPAIGKMFDTSQGGELTLKPWNSQMGIADTAYSRIKKFIADLKGNPSDFEGLKNARDALGDKIDPLSDDRAAKQITQAKAAVMDYMQGLVQKVNPDLNVRQTFAKWAQNEQDAQLFEQKFGAQLATSGFRSLAKGKPEESILPKIFSDSATTQAAKRILGPEKFANVLADYMTMVRNDPKIFDKGELSANKFYTKIGKGNSKYAMDEAFGNHAQPYQDIKDAVTTMRNFTDDMPANPSGTAPTFFRGLLKAGIKPSEQWDNLVESAKRVGEGYKTRQAINASMGNQAGKYDALKLIQAKLKSVTSDITSESKSIFNNDTLKRTVIAGAVQLSKDKYDKISQQISEFSANPGAALEHMSSNTADMHDAAPNITQSLNNSLVNGATFLQSKMPQPPQSFPLSQKWAPSTAQLNQFSKYYTAVDKPTVALKQVNNGTLSNETMEALQTVHPQLLSEMRQQVISHMNIEKAKGLDYGKRIALAKFLGQPLDQSMTPQMIQSTQMMYNPPLAPSPAPRQRKLPLGGLKQLKLSNRTSTEANREDD